MLPDENGRKVALVDRAWYHPPTMPDRPEKEFPLCVDLDGTLVKTDMLLETTVRPACHAPVARLRAAAVAREGTRAPQARDRAPGRFHPSLLPNDEALLADLRRQRGDGRLVVLATASDAGVADRIAEHLDIFDPHPRERRRAQSQG